MIMKNDITPKRTKVVFGKDSVVIRKYFSGIPGGRTLDCSDHPEDNIYAGHVIIKKADGNYAPMPIKAATEAVGETPASPAGYDTLPTGAKYVGVLYRSISKDKPAASIMTHGIVNPTLTPYPMDSIMDAFTAAVKNISFEQDEEA